MKSVDMDKVISFGELQKLSSKKLRKADLPLFVMDFKSKKKVFVILDIESFAQFSGGVDIDGRAERGKKPKKPSTLSVRSMGLLWDRPSLTDEGFSKALHDVRHPDHAWALKRLLEYAKSDAAIKMLSLQELKNAVEQIPLRSPYKEAWANAVHYWAQNP